MLNSIQSLLKRMTNNNEPAPETGAQTINPTSSDFLKTLPSNNGYANVPLVNSLSESLRTIDRRLVDYDKHDRNDIVSFIAKNSNKSLLNYTYTYNFTVSLSFINVRDFAKTSKPVVEDLSQYITTLEEYCNYEDQVMNFFKIRLALPRWLYASILQALNRSKEGKALEFKLNVRKLKNKYINTQVTSADGFLQPDTSTGYFNIDPYKDLIVIPIDNDNKLMGQFSFTNLIANVKEQDNDTKYKLELVLFPKAAIKACKKTFDFQNASLSGLQQITDTVLESLKTSTEEPIKEIMTSPIHNTNTIESLAIEKMDLVELFSYLDQYFGLYTFGSRFFFTGNSLFFSDTQVEDPELVKNKPNVYINVFPAASSPELAVNGMIFLNGNVHCSVNEQAVTIIDTAASALELFGDNLRIISKSGQTSLLLPRNLLRRNFPILTDGSGASEERTKSYHKNDDSIFFETRLINSYSKESGYIDLIINNVDPAYFFLGKHVYMNFTNPELTSIHSDEYLVVNKTVIIDRVSATVNGNKVKLRLRRVVNEIPYDYVTQLSMLPIYSENQVNVNSVIQNAMNSVFGGPQVSVGGMSKEQLDALAAQVTKSGNAGVYLTVPQIKKVLINKCILSFKLNKNTIPWDLNKMAEQIYTSSITYKVDPKLVLAQGITECHWACNPAAKVSKETKNIFNVGNTDDGSKKFLSTYYEGVDIYFKLMAREYLYPNEGDTVTTEMMVRHDFHRPKGGRYATAPNYTTMVANLVQGINKCILNPKLPSDLS
jgi:hypothetical protein